MGRSEEDLLGHLQEQVYFLHSAAMAFDTGPDLEAKRLCAPLRLLFHETAMSKALLNQLGWLDDLRMYDTARPMHSGDGVSTGEYSLVFVALGQGRFVPNLDNDTQLGAKWTSFADWWRTPILRDSEAYTLTREAVVLGMAHEDGGAHVDPVESAAYSRFLNDSLGWASGDDAESSKMRSPVFASVRQIAHETLVSLAHASVQAFPSAVPRRRYRYLPGPTVEQVYAATALIGGMVLHGETLDGEPWVDENAAKWPGTVGRDDPCPCGSGRKYKNCHGC